MKISRFQAFAGHLSGSILVGLCSTALVFFVWYPWPLPSATGVAGIFLIMLSVDAVIGPCITLIVFNPCKKTGELKRDLAVVLILQVSALLYGIYTVYTARPAYLVFNVDRFDLVYANDLDPEKLNKVSDERFKSVPWSGPKIIAARAPESSGARTELMLNAIAGGDDFPQLPQYYVPYTDVKPQVYRSIQPLDKLKEFNKGHAGKVAALINRYASVSGSVGFLPLRGKIADLCVIVNKESTSILEIANLKPWP